MEIKRVVAMYFSATDTTKNICEYIAKTISEKTSSTYDIINYTSKKARNDKFNFDETTLVIFASPTYAGRIPNILLPFLENNIEGKDALTVPIVLFGNRNYDDSLIELRNILESNNFHTIAGGAFVGEHSFSNTLAKNRPDEKDFELADKLCDLIIQRLNQDKITSVSPVNVKGENPIRPYFKPRDRNGEFIDIRKVRPKINNNCNDCKVCAEVCPMEAIDKNDIHKYNNICIKCGACIKKCPANARYYDDEGYLYHKKELEEAYSRRAKSEIF